MYERPEDIVYRRRLVLVMYCSNDMGLDLLEGDPVMEASS